jgi:hypothetical protein
MTNIRALCIAYSWSCGAVRVPNKRLRLLRSVYEHAEVGVYQGGAITQVQAVGDGQSILKSKGSLQLILDRCQWAQARDMLNIERMMI